VIFYPFGAELIVELLSAGFTGGYSYSVLSGHFFLETRVMKKIVSRRE